MFKSIIVAVVLAVSLTACHEPDKSAGGTGPSTTSSQPSGLAGLGK
jgi:uncharacterized lipoprotein YehR (DUF1307 family)